MIDNTASPPAEWRRSLHRVQLTFGVALACLAIIGFVSYRSVVQLTEVRTRIGHTQHVINELTALLTTVGDAAAAHRGFAVTGSNDNLKMYAAELQRNQSAASELARLFNDDAVQRQRLAELASLLSERFAGFDLVIEARRSRGLEGAMSALATHEASDVHSKLRALVQTMIDAERTALSVHEQNVDHSVTVTTLVIVVGSALALAFVVFALAIIRRDFAGRERAESQLERFFSLSLDLLCIASGDGYFKRVNQAVTDILGWSVDEFMARPFVEWVHPDDREATTREVERLVLRGEKVLYFENRYLHKNGAWRVLAWRAMPQPGGLIFAAARDVTELRSHERALREAKEQLESRVVERTLELQHTSRHLERQMAERDTAERKLQAQMQRLGLLHRITRAIDEHQDIGPIGNIVVSALEEQMPVNCACLLMYDAATESLTFSSLGGHCARLATDLDLKTDTGLDLETSGLAECMRGQLLYEPNLSVLPLALPQRLARAGLRSLVATPLIVASKVLGVLLAIREQEHGFENGECEFLKQLSEHVALAAQQAKLYGALQGAYDDLRHTQQAVMQQERLRVLGQMASGIAHDINNAITPASIYTHLLLARETTLSEQARDFLKTIQRAIDDVAATVARMREFYRPRDASAFAPVQVNPLVLQVVNLTRVRWTDMAQQTGVVIDLSTDLASDLPSVMGVESEIREALTNLVFNAVDAMPRGGKLTLRTSVANEPNAPSSTVRNVKLEVVDSGIGMDEETRRRCMELFYTTKGERGTGLGLAMVYGTMERHGGTVDIASAPGRGTTITLLFPVAVGDAQAHPLAPQAMPRKLRVLVIDDDPVLLQSLYHALHGDGHMVTAASGGEHGLQLFRATHDTASEFDIVITDLGMPRVDGRQVVSTIKSLSPHTPVIMLTGWGQRIQAEGDVPAFVDRVLTKPPRLQDLRTALAELTAIEEEDKPQVKANRTEASVS